MDNLIESFTTNNNNGNGISYEQWLNYSVPKNFYKMADSIKISDIENMLWIKSKKLFNIIMRETAFGTFQTALECNVW